ncbi:restriction endonuclease subunit S [Cronobacter sakazakii]|uniref:restriction endonuclease subunit S n=1 Tax=Cronobacter sakazakii TaxID=28141 RepID=UPI000940B0C6|nr:restriction endonuclease subunit S [Cronobacter sakazakii]EGT5649880.1 restriction endonuclease subunit S [Cronobacter sakazakii]EGT5748607.1 restriction endonuclease subunit S [Cronobacter sakazakii]EIZ8992491.1 restriction endonuclease subunit S [Cronobacter sakazakii]EJV9473335.1 restriction endonuclease subunit S [Cronobacter sakazakii]EKK5200003.1 restriction endonuclease subunit S [Cronobacter sakazakii]
MSGGKLPEGWIVTNLQNIANWGSGGTPSRSHDDYYNGNIPWFKTGDLGPKLITEASEYITDVGVKNSSAKYFPKGSVAIAMYGATIGKTSILGIDATTNQACAVGSPIEGITSSIFLYYFLLNEKNSFIKKGKGGAQPNISQAVIKEHPLSLPPYAEQKIIAEKLDTLLAQVESTKARLEQIPQILKRFRQAVLAAAVRGELTEGWHTDQNLVSAKSILNEIETERSQAKNNKLIKQSFGKYKVISPLFNIPSNSWEWVCLEQICATNNNALKAGPFGSALKKADCVEVGYKVYGQEQVISGSESLETYRINDDKYEQLKSCTTGPGDILISLVGTIGKVLVLSPQAEFGIINPRLVKITLHNTISPQYIKTYLDSPVSHSFFKGFSHGGTMEILNLSILKELPIALPPLEEQHEIVRRVEQLFAYADTIEKQVNNALNRVNSLTQSILAKAFRGELTAQWRAENPELISGENSAAALLEKIKAERAASGGKKTARKKA